MLYVSESDLRKKHPETLNYNWLFTKLLVFTAEALIYSDFFTNEGVRH